MCGRGSYSRAGVCCTGLNILLISRTQAKLDEAAADIQFKYKVQAKTLAIDFSKADAAAWERVKAKVGANGQASLSKALCVYLLQCACVRRHPGQGQPCKPWVWRHGAASVRPWRPCQGRARGCQVLSTTVQYV